MKILHIQHYAPFAHYHMLQCEINEHTNSEREKLLYIGDMQGASSRLGRLQLPQHVKLSLCVHLVLTLSISPFSLFVIIYLFFSSTSYSCSTSCFGFLWILISLLHLCLKWLKACPPAFLPPSLLISVHLSIFLCVWRRNDYTSFHSFIHLSHFSCVTAQIYNIRRRECDWKRDKDKGTDM